MWRIERAEANLERVIGMVNLADGKVATITSLVSAVRALQRPAARARFALQACPSARVHVQVTRVRRCLSDAPPH